MTGEKIGKRLKVKGERIKKKDWRPEGKD